MNISYYTVHFTCIILPFSLMMHVKSWVDVFSFEKQIFSLKNVVNMGNKLPNHIKVGRQCAILELVEILPVCNIHFVMWCNMWLIIGIQISFQIKWGFMYSFIHCSCQYVEHVNYSQLTVTLSVFEKCTNYEQNLT